MKRMYAIIFVIVGLLISTSVLMQNWSKHNMLYTPISGKPIVTSICSSFPQGYGYIVDEYRNGKNEIGGFIAHSMIATGASIYNYDTEGKRVGEIVPLPDDHSLTKDNATAGIWQLDLINDFPIKKTYECDTLGIVSNKANHTALYGQAVNVKQGAEIINDTYGPVLMEGLMAWPPEAVGKTVFVTGSGIEKQVTVQKAIVDKNGLVSQGAEEEIQQWVLLEPITWKVQAEF